MPVAPGERGSSMTADTQIVQANIHMWPLDVDSCSRVRRHKTAQAEQGMFAGRRGEQYSDAIAEQLTPRKLVAGNLIGQAVKYENVKSKATNLVQSHPSGIVTKPHSMRRATLPCLTSDRFPFIGDAWRSGSV